MVTAQVAVDVATAQRRTVAVLAATQVLGGVGVAVGVAVAALLAAALATDSMSGLAGSASVVGAALLAVPVSRFMDARGRRAGLALAYLLGVVGALAVVASAFAHSFPGALVGMLLFGGATTAGLQARYAATDLAEPARRGAALSTVVWATTVGAVLGPNLAGPVGDLAERLGVPPLAGPFLLSAVAFGLAAASLVVLLRPDPLRLARTLRGGRTSGAGGEPAFRPRGSVRTAVRLIRRTPAALLGLAAITVGHAAMVGVMSMTPVHLHHGGASLRVIGAVISFHIAGMYAASPLVGRAADRVGRRTVVVAGAVLLLSALAVSGTASGDDATRLAAGLTLLGLGWSCTLIAGSTLLTEAVPAGSRPAVQGAADLVMGIAGATAGVLAGVVVGYGSYGLLTVVTAVPVVPLAVAALRGARVSLRA
jgi:MFS family permease